MGGKLARLYGKMIKMNKIETYIKPKNTITTDASLAKPAVQCSSYTIVVNQHWLLHSSI